MQFVLAWSQGCALSQICEISDHHRPHLAAAGKQEPNDAEWMSDLAHT